MAGTEYLQAVSKVFHLLHQVSSPTPSVEQELLWVDKRLTQLQTSLSLLTTPAEKLLASFESRNLSNFK